MISVQPLGIALIGTWIPSLHRLVAYALQLGRHCGLKLIESVPPPRGVQMNGEKDRGHDDDGNDADGKWTRAALRRCVRQQQHVEDTQHTGRRGERNNRRHGRAVRACDCTMGLREACSALRGVVHEFHLSGGPDRLAFVERRRRRTWRWRQGRARRGLRRNRNGCQQRCRCGSRRC